MAEGGERLQATAHREYHQLWNGPGALRYHGRSVFFGHVFLAPASIARLHGLFTVPRSRRMATFVACLRPVTGGGESRRPRGDSRLRWWWRIPRASTRPFRR
ncbi:unnamed protein product, partial [Ectocarpus sp. 12 AP-2014]